MPRWEPNARSRLEQAALALYGERGFEQTTVADIAERAGLTERTFFRYFADKREVLFGGASQLQDRLVAAVAGAPGAEAPMEAVRAGLRAIGPSFDERRADARRRRAVIAANPGLQQRELVKLATLSAAVAEALGSRGVTGMAASLAADAGIGAFKVAFARWLGSRSASFASVVDEAFEELRRVTRGEPAGRS